MVGFLDFRASFLILPDELLEELAVDHHLVALHIVAFDDAIGDM